MSKRNAASTTAATAAKLGTLLQKYHGDKLCKSPESDKQQLGDYYIIDRESNVVSDHVDLLRLLRQVLVNERHAIDMWKETKLKAKREQVLFNLTVPDVYQMIVRPPKRSGHKSHGTYAAPKFDFPQVLLDSLFTYGQERAADDNLPFQLTEPDISEIALHQYDHNVAYLKPNTWQHFQQLMFGAVVACNQMVLRGVSVSDALTSLQESRKAAMGSKRRSKLG
jgi:hypothetical protein